ncbi:uncharacterized protein LOC121052320 [Rosa chinensis]|uniref:uncharacterized protein LOC121052320 n=1 Tax=Rosa chinensis TaxID=74649 RepID=UPI001AD8DAA5|nr:uncharacterized protein LOC121052320 [Rosa chinensis]
MGFQSAKIRVPFVGHSICGFMGYSIWGFVGFPAILAGLPYLQRICSRPSSPTIPRPLHHYFQQLDIETRQKKTQCYADIESVQVWEIARMKASNNFALIMKVTNTRNGLENLASVLWSVMLWLILYLGPSKFVKLGSDLES